MEKGYNFNIRCAVSLNKLVHSARNIDTSNNVKIILWTNELCAKHDKSEVDTRFYDFRSSAILPYDLLKIVATDNC